MIKRIAFLLIIFLFFGLKESFSLPNLPEEIFFAGQKIDLEKTRYLKERVEAEFYDYLQDKESVLTAKRAGRYFPIFEKALAEAGLDEDWKYLAITESNLKPMAGSMANASGLWQFIPSTGKRFGLKINAIIDERYDPVLASEAAVKYIKELLSLFNNDIFLAMAGYNAGENNITNALKQQGIKDFWSLYYRNKNYPHNETLRYVPRVIAAKIIFSDIDRYFGLSESELYKPFEFNEISVEVKEKLKSLVEIAKEHSSALLDLKTLNPQIKTDYLPRGKYKIKFPVK
ncbi:MAG: lytic transglycosylase domain-containing protein [Parcubacteria group bacterium]|nr:lytic transglycosylase domain-containing protein [Parcubacteria group bacterium]